jgi:hypothetical protein
MGSYNITQIAMRETCHRGQLINNLNILPCVMLAHEHVLESCAYGLLLTLLFFMT